MAFICEGKTERKFVEAVVSPHLLQRGIASVSSEIGQEFLSPGGNVSLARVVRDVEIHLSASDFVTTVVDFYGIARDWLSLCGPAIHEKATADKAALAEKVALEYAAKNLKGVDGIERRFIPNVLMHEFEGLLLTSPETIVRITRAPRQQEALQREIEGFSCPEDINSGRDTSPSKRIVKCRTNYGKTRHGARIAEQIGLPSLRANCPHFNAWLTRLEALSVDHGLTP